MGGVALYFTCDGVVFRTKGEVMGDDVYGGVVFCVGLVDTV